MARHVVSRSTPKSARVKLAAWPQATRDDYLDALRHPTWLAAGAVLAVIFAGFAWFLGRMLSISTDWPTSAFIGIAPLFSFYIAAARGRAVDRRRRSLNLSAPLDQ
jgi:hypothetical protein